MRLISFQVERFRNIVNSEPIEAQHDVTALVGKNESVTALTEIPRFCSSKFPTLGRSAA